MALGEGKYVCSNHRDSPPVLQLRDDACAVDLRSKCSRRHTHQFALSGWRASDIGTRTKMTSADVSIDMDDNQEAPRGVPRRPPLTRRPFSFVDPSAIRAPQTSRRAGPLDHSPPPIYLPPRSHPIFTSQQSLIGGADWGCQCQCRKNSGGVKDMSSASTIIDEETTESLSWRRLHMSRAKLKATATTSELLSGFAMVAMVELQINEPTNVPEWLFVMFSVCTTILVAVHIFALMISTYLLPNIDAVSKLHVRGLVSESPHERMRGFIELAWAFSTVLGLFLFLVEVAILCWVKFWDYSFTAAWAATVIVIPVLVLFVAFAVHFYHTLVVYKCESSVANLAQLEDLKLKLDSVSSQA